MDSTENKFSLKFLKVPCVQFPMCTFQKCELSGFMDSGLFRQEHQGRMSTVQWARSDCPCFYWWGSDKIIKASRDVISASDTMTINDMSYGGY